MSVAFVPALLARAARRSVRRLQGLYPDKRGALLPVLHMAQDTFGWISLEAEEYLAGPLRSLPAHVHEVVTFYTLFFQRPEGAPRRGHLPQSLVHPARIRRTSSGT